MLIVIIGTRSTTVSHISAKSLEDGSLLVSTRNSNPEYVEIPSTLRPGEGISNPPYDYMQVNLYMYISFITNADLNFALFYTANVDINFAMLSVCTGGIFKVQLSGQWTIYRSQWTSYHNQQAIL